MSINKLGVFQKASRENTLGDVRALLLIYSRLSEPLTPMAEELLVTYGVARWRFGEAYPKGEYYLAAEKEQSKILSQEEGVTLKQLFSLMVGEVGVFDCLHCP